MRIRMKEPSLKELHQECFLCYLGHLLDFLRRTGAQFLPVHPFAHQYSSGAEFFIDVGDHDALYIVVYETLTQPLLILSLVREIELRVEPDGPFVEQCHIISPLLRRKPLYEPLPHLRRPPQHVKVLADRGQHVGTLHLHRHPGVFPVVQSRQVDLGKTGRRHGLLADGGEELSQRSPQLPLDLGHRFRGRKGLHRVLQYRQFVQGGLRQHVGTDAHHLSRFDEGGTQKLQIEPGLPTQRGNVLFPDLALRDEQGGEFGQKRHHAAHEHAPPCVQSSPLLRPVLRDELRVIPQGQAVFVRARRAAVQRNVGFLDGGSLQRLHCDGGVHGRGGHGGGRRDARVGEAFGDADGFLPGGRDVDFYFGDGRRRCVAYFFDSGSCVRRGDVFDG
mmetsp:Transcript_35916/g.83771  ORF Transcript_35916/g.83771 Transcript_35916/m.83771 type:complete len:389 (+) Transcript_35916:1435-2601(+)